MCLVIQVDSKDDVWSSENWRDTMFEDVIFNKPFDDLKVKYIIKL